MRVEPTANVLASGEISGVTVDADRIANGIELMSSLGSVTATVTKTRVLALTVGMLVSAGVGPVVVSARDLVLSGVGLGYGVAVEGGGATLRIAHSISTNWQYGLLAQNGALIESYGDNNLRGNLIGPVNLIGLPLGQFATVQNR
jgi:hypothetical protein